MDVALRVRLTVEVPQLDGVMSELQTLREQLMAGLGNITDALNQLEQTLNDELTQIHDALMNSPTQEEIDAVALRVTDLKDRIANIIP